MRVLPDEQVEQAGAHHDGHARALHGKADAARSQLVHDAGRGCQTERAAAGQHHGVHGFDHVLGLEQVGLAGGGTAAAHVNAAGCSGGCDDDGAAGARGGVFGVRAAKSRQVGKRGGLKHGILPFIRYVTCDSLIVHRLADRTRTDVGLWIAGYGGTVKHLRCVLPL